MPVEASLDALLAQTGVIRVDTLEELFDVARLLSAQPVPRGRRVAVLSNSWGPAVLAADACVGAGLELAELGADTRRTISALMPEGRDLPESSTGTPIDLGYQADARGYRAALEALVADPHVDALLVLCTPPLPSTLGDVAATIAAVSTGSSVPVVATFLGLDAPSLDAGSTRVPVFEFPEAAAHALGRVARYGEWLAHDPGESVTLGDDELAAVGAEIERIRETLSDPAASSAEAGDWLTPADAVALLSALHLPMVAREFVDDADGAVDAARRIGWPIALKATGIDRPARTEAGGVAVDVHGDTEVREAFARMEASLGSAMHPAVVQAMAPPGVNCRIEVHQHPEVGAVLVLGPDVRDGQMQTSNDVAIQILPVTPAEAGRLIDGSALAGPLGESDDPDAAKAHLVDLVVRVGALADAVADIRSLVLDPVLVSPSGANVTDVRARLTASVPQPEPEVRRL